MRILTARWPGLALVLSLSIMMWLPIGWAKGPSSSLLLLLPPPLFSQCEAHGPPNGVGREKNIVYDYILVYLEPLSTPIHKFGQLPS